MPDAMTTLLANVGLSDLERRLRDEAIDETTILDLDEADMKEIGLKMGPRRKLLTAIREAKDRRTTPGADWARSPPPPPPPPRRRRGPTSWTGSSPPCSRTRSTSRRSSRRCGTCRACWFVVRRRRRSRLATEIVRIKTKVDAYLDRVL
jgi:hypothetical protein